MTATFVMLSLLVAAPDRPTLAGRVLAIRGKPVAGAHVLIDSAGVRQGTSPLCPSSYADCRKSTETDQQGRFRIAPVDPELVFNILVVADGFRPTFAMKSDPSKGPVEVRLIPFNPAGIDPKQILQGVVLDPGGKPLVGAKVTAQQFSTDAYSGFSPDIFDPVAVTNLRGEFVLTSKSSIEYADLKVVGNGVAPRIVPSRKPEENPQRITMIAGATLTGLVAREGKPVPGAVIGLVQASRSSSTFLGDTTIGTDREGRFTFLNVHPDEEYFIYGLMESFKDGSAVLARQVRSGADGETTDIGLLPVVRGHRIKGRVVLSDGKPIPPKTRLMLSRENAWDTVRIDLDPEGRFALAGLPTERYSLNVWLKGYKISSKNHSVDPQNPWRLIGTIDQDIDTLKVLLEPGAQ